MRVLLVDDDPIVLRFLADLFQARGCEVLSVQPVEADGGRCVEAAAAFRPDLLVVDLQMPIDPATVVAAVRQASAHARVLLCTGTLVTEEERARVGVDDVLAKPFTPSDLDRAIARAGLSPEGASPA